MSLAYEFHSGLVAHHGDLHPAARQKPALPATLRNPQWCIALSKPPSCFGFVGDPPRRVGLGSKAPWASGLHLAGSCLSLAPTSLSRASSAAAIKATTGSTGISQANPHRPPLSREPPRLLSDSQRFILLSADQSQEQGKVFNDRRPNLRRVATGGGHMLPSTVSLLAPYSSPSSGEESAMPGSTVLTLLVLMHCL